jgi:hypothetical protein
MRLVAFLILRACIAGLGLDEVALVALQYLTSDAEQSSLKSTHLKAVTAVLPVKLKVGFTSGLNCGTWLLLLKL